jgi:hypothetical protein
MENERAIEIIKGELMHCQIHLEDKNKAPEYYQEMNELCEAYEMAIKALENSSPVLMMQNMSAEDIEKIKLIWQRKTSKSISNQNLVVADVLDDYAGRLAQSKDIPIRMSNEKYVDVVSSLRYAIAYLRT